MYMEPIQSLQINNCISIIWRSFSLPSPGRWGCQGWSRQGWWGDSWSRYSECHSPSWQAAETWPSPRHRTERRPHTCRNLDTDTKTRSESKNITTHVIRGESGSQRLWISSFLFAAVCACTPHTHHIPHCLNRQAVVPFKEEVNVYDWTCQRVGCMPTASVTCTYMT